jgi:hypothetical protein
MNLKGYSTLFFIILGGEMTFNSPCIPGGDKALGFHDCEPAQPHTEDQRVCGSCLCAPSDGLGTATGIVWIQSRGT